MKSKPYPCIEMNGEIDELVTYGEALFKRQVLGTVQKFIDKPQVLEVEYEEFERTEFAYKTRKRIVFVSVYVHRKFCIDYVGESRKFHIDQHVWANAPMIFSYATREVI